MLYSPVVFLWPRPLCHCSEQKKATLPLPFSSATCLRVAQTHPIRGFHWSSISRRPLTIPSESGGQLQRQQRKKMFTLQERRVIPAFQYCEGGVIYSPVGSADSAGHHTVKETHEQIDTSTTQPLLNCTRKAFVLLAQNKAFAYNSREL